MMMSGHWTVSGQLSSQGPVGGVREVKCMIMSNDSRAELSSLPLTSSQLMCPTVAEEEFLEEHNFQ